MKMPRLDRVSSAALGLLVGVAGRADAQCCLDGLFAGCCRKPAAYAVAPVAAPVMAPVVAPVPAPPPPVMVPVQQTSYVPETTYRTQYQTVPVTTYKPSCEIDPCTGCTRECMQPVTQYVQQAVNVPVTQYRAVTTTKYVQMQPGYGGGYPAVGQQAIAAPAAAAAAAAPATSPFAAPVQTGPQGWGAAGADIPQQLVPGAAPPALPATGVPQQTYQQPIMPQSGSVVPSAPQAIIQPQPTQPPALGPTPTTVPSPSLKPIPELPRATTTPVAPPAFSPSNGAAGPAATAPQAPATSGTIGGPQGMPVVPGPGPKSSTGAFPRLLEPTGHTTSWQPAMLDIAPPARRPGYPTAVLPARLQQ